MIHDVLYVVSNLQGYQTGALIESMSPNRCYAVWDRYCRQFRAIIESIISNRCYAIGKRYCG